MNLLNEAKGQSSKQGVPLNPLETVTPDELTSVLEPLIAGLPLEKKLKLVVSLLRGSWLLSDEAARLAGVDEATLTKEQDGADDKAHGAGSDT